MTDTFVIIKKYNNSRSSWERLRRKNKILDISLEEVIKKHDSFEGNFEEFLTETDVEIALQLLEEKYERLKTEQPKNDFLLLYITTIHSEIPSIIKSLFHLIGFDYGWAPSDSGVYSSIFHEIIFGNVPELIVFKGHLNNHLLFDNNTVAVEYSKLHHNLLEAGKDVEHDEDMEIYEIWKYKGSVKLTV